MGRHARRGVRREAVSGGGISCDMVNVRRLLRVGHALLQMEEQEAERNWIRWRLKARGQEEKVCFRPPFVRSLVRECADGRGGQANKLS